MAADSAADRFLIGLLGDIQYADRDDRPPRFAGDRGRYYRNSLEIVKAAVSAFNDRRVNAVVTLGDMIDGHCAGGDDPSTMDVRARASEACLERVLSELRSLKMPRYDLIGNHDVYNFSCDQMKATGLELGDAGRTYYVHQYGNWDLIFLNTFEHFIGAHQGTTAFEESFEVFQRYRPDADDMILQRDLQVKSDGTRLGDSELHLTAMNGAMSDAQRAWLRETLRATEAAGRSAIVFSHAPIFGWRFAFCLPWDSAEILAIVHEFQDTVYAVVSGHYHKGGYDVDTAGIHHVVIPAPVEVRPAGDSWAFLELRDGSARLECPRSGPCVPDRTGSQLYEIELRKSYD